MVAPISRKDRARRAQARRRQVFFDPHTQPAANLWGRHEGADVFVVGTGTSLAGFDFTRLAGRVTIALNDAIRAQGLDPAYHLFHDHGLWVRYHKLTLHPRTWVVCGPTTRKQLIKDSKCSFKDRILWYVSNGAPTVERLDNQLYIDRTIATAGIHMAWKLGARRIFLLGVDGYRQPDGAYYWDGQAKPVEQRRERRLKDSKLFVQDRHDDWAENMRRLRRFFDDGELYPFRWPGPGVYNLSPLSTIDAWEKRTVEEALQVDREVATG